MTGEYADYPGEGKSRSLESQRVSGKKALMYVDVPNHIKPHEYNPDRSYEHLRGEHKMKWPKEPGMLHVAQALEQRKFTKPQVRYPLAVGVAQPGEGSGDFWLDDSDDFNLKDNVRLVHQWED